MCKRKPNRRYSFESMRARIQTASSEAELESLSDLLYELMRASVITVSKFRDLDIMIDQRLCALVMEVKR